MYFSSVDVAHLTFGEIACDNHADRVFETVLLLLELGVDGCEAAAAGSDETRCGDE